MCAGEELRISSAAVDRDDGRILNRLQRK